jgi:uncharacterized protein (TIGR00369 family)
MEPLDPHTFGPDQQCFGCGPTNRTGMQLRFFRDGDDVVTTFEAREGWEGAPGIVHGGLQATLADEIGAWALIGTKGRFGFTSSLNLRYLRPARADRPIEARARIVDDLGSRAKVRIELSQDGHKLVAGTATYVMPTEALAEHILGQPLPEEWKHLARPEDSAE